MGRRMLPKPPEGGHPHQQRSHSLDRSAELHMSSQDDIFDDDDNDMAAAAAAAANAILNASFSGPTSLPISSTSSSQSPRGRDRDGKRKNSESGLSDILVGEGATASKFAPDGCSLQVKFKKTLPKFRHTYYPLLGPKRTSFW